MSSVQIIRPHFYKVSFCLLQYLVSGLHHEGFHHPWVAISESNRIFVSFHGYWVDWSKHIWWTISSYCCVLVLTFLLETAYWDAVSFFDLFIKQSRQLHYSELVICIPSTCCGSLFRSSRLLCPSRSCQSLRLVIAISLMSKHCASFFSTFNRKSLPTVCICSSCRKGNRKFCFPCRLQKVFSSEMYCQSCFFQLPNSD